MEGKSGSLVPSPNVVEKLSEYADVLAKFGPGSPEAAAFHHANEHLPLFTENAHDLERLEQEDRDWPGLKP